MKEETSFQRGEDEPFFITDAARAHVGGNLAEITGSWVLKTYSPRLSHISFKIVVLNKIACCFFSNWMAKRWAYPPPRPSPRRTKPDGGDDARRESFLYLSRLISHVTWAYIYYSDLLMLSYVGLSTSLHSFNLTQQGFLLKPIDPFRFHIWPLII